MLEPSSVCERDVGFVSDDDVVEQLDAEEFGDMVDASCEGTVFGRGFGIAAGVVVDEDHTNGFFAHGGGKDVLWHEWTAVDTAFADLELSEQVISLVE